MAEPTTTLVVAIVGVALIFDFINGFHDAANSIATVVSTRVLSPRAAVLWAAFFNFVAFLFFGLHVAKTIGKGTIDPAAASLAVVTAALVSAIVWNLLTWWLAIPSSSSHALVGGLAGAAFAAHGPSALVIPGLVKIGVFIFVAPLLGMALSLTIMVVTYWCVRHATPARVSKLFRRLQLLSAAAYSLGHGGNDAQKTMGIIFMVMIASGRLPADTAAPPFWIVLACHAAIGLGTLCGGWRIVATMGQKICKLQPIHGFAAEMGGSLTLYGATYFGIPVSTTHTITGAIMGAGATKRLSAVRWGLGSKILVAWVITLPITAVCAAVVYWILRSGFGME
jgi:PiT family inorganic phosphate transporter